VRKVIEQLNIDATAEMNPPESMPADLSDQPPEQSDQVPNGQGTVNRLAEDELRSIRRIAGLLTETEIKENVLTDDTGSTLQHIKDTFKRDVKDFETTGEISDELHDALYDYYHDDMPYGVQKARTGDPYEWVADRFGADLGLEGYGGNSPGVPDEDYGMERESVMHGDYAEEAREPHSVDGGMENPLIQDEGVAGSLVGAAIGALTPIPGGATIGSIAGDAIQDKLADKEEADKNDMSLFNDSTCNMSEAGESCPVHGVEECYANSVTDSSPLAGQYGHSGKMKEVGKETSFLDRLKELSGMIRN
jgi:hypothetical protein